MRIKRYTAPDMRTALRQVREEQGADAVILSSRPCGDGIEVVAATDYDEALVQQALRAAAPERAPVAAGRAAAVAPTPAPLPAAADAPAAAPERKSLAERAREVFRRHEPAADGHHPDATLAELTAPHAATGAGRAPRPAPARAAAAPGAAAPASPRFEAMMAALGAQATPAERATPAQAVAAVPAVPAPVQVPGHNAPAEAVPAPMAATAPVPPASGTATAAAIPAGYADADAAIPVVPAAGPQLRAVPDPDPSIVAMREELASMRRLIEREMGQFTVERLRGSPARAAAYDLLIGYGCDESLAQTVATRIDAALPPHQVRAPALAHLARMLTVVRNEPLDDGGVIALVGPTGAGKTTTVAKLAARFAARHRARDVALVTTDIERVGAREQLHAHGRRLGITVCEAAGAQGLAEALEHLRDYPLVLVDTAGYGSRDRALLGQITWLRATRDLRSLLVLPANAHPHDLNEVVRRYRLASPEAAVLTKTDETGHLGGALSVLVRNGLGLAYTSAGQQVPADLDCADASRLVLQLEKLRRAADNPLATEDRHAIA